MDTTPRATRTIGAFNTWLAAQSIGQRAAQQGHTAPPDYFTADERREWRAGFYGLCEATTAPAPERASLIARVIRWLSL